VAVTVVLLASPAGAGAENNPKPFDDVPARVASTVQVRPPPDTLVRVVLFVCRVVATPMMKFPLAAAPFVVTATVDEDDVPVPPADCNAFTNATANLGADLDLHERETVHSRRRVHAESERLDRATTHISLGFLALRVLTDEHPIVL
jgi:hypothetical protein